MKKLLGLCCALWAGAAQAKIYLDIEEDPLPLVQISVVIPAGGYTGAVDETGLAMLIPEILDAGTANKDKQSFVDALSTFGANQDFAVIEEFSTWTLNFPYVATQNYDELIALLQENWRSPRWTPEVFELSKKKLLASLQGGLDSDGALSTIPSRRWALEKFMGLKSNSLQKVQSFNLEKTREVFEKHFTKAADIWVGYIGPKSLEPLVKKIVTSVFSQQGKVKVGQHLELLTAKVERSVKIQNEKRLFIIDKKDRNQSVTKVFALSPKKIEGDDELNFFFGRHLLVGGGLGSLFWDEIRGKRGLAYSVSDETEYYFMNPVLGFATNPLRTKSDEAFKLIAELVKSSYETGTSFKGFDNEAWDRHWKSFQFSHLIDLSTASGRLSHRLAVVTGVLSRDLYEKPVQKWRVSRQEIEKLFPLLWKDAFKSVSVVGNAKELRPLVEKYFPDYSVSVLPYNEVITDKFLDHVTTK